MGDEGAKALARILRGHPSLKALKMGNNLIGVEGHQALADALEGNQVLEQLKISVIKVAKGVYPAKKSVQEP